MMDRSQQGEGARMERNLSQDLIARDWQEYADACLCHDTTEPVCSHSYDLAHCEDVLAVTVSTSLSGDGRVRLACKNPMWE